MPLNCLNDADLLKLKTDFRQMLKISPVTMARRGANTPLVVAEVVVVAVVVAAWALGLGGSP